MVKFFVGLDVGATNVRVNFFETQGNKLGTTIVFPFKQCRTATEEVESNICKPIEHIVQENQLDIKGMQGIGMSVAANFDRKTGDVVKWPNNGLWNGFKLSSYLENKYRIPIIMEDDANCAALGEFIMGSAAGLRNFVYITVSTGIGCGLILNGDLYTGNNGWAGEIGHVVMRKDGPICKCGVRGCLQSMASGPAILRRTKELAKNAGISIDECYKLEQVFEYPEEVAPYLEQSCREAAEYLSELISKLIMILDISDVILGGGVTRAGSVFMEPLNRILKDYAHCSGRKVTLKLAQLGDNSGTIGAVNLIYKHLNNGDDIKTIY
ncbi:ROK family protein [Ruminiclostridium papyrosolvens]|uniref:ROK family transcriptional regulator n=1 Tax=Ruminiclostridium papyrosolvens C7 TaxID=1330534 RepID=U4R048_9FIRM|nr:ROK family protein [Ruminiclostridium papyrosolvens]EPR10816.1 hypothetical protein L323_12320 [Ruminiclostridium papyrosolvens C7]